MKYASFAVALLINSTMAIQRLSHMKHYPDVTFLQEDPAPAELEGAKDEKKDEKKAEVKPEFGNEGFNSGKDQSQKPCDD